MDTYSLLVGRKSAVVELVLGATGVSKRARRRDRYVKQQHDRELTVIVPSLIPLNVAMT